MSQLPSPFQGSREEPSSVTGSPAGGAEVPGRSLSNPSPHERTYYGRDYEVVPVRPMGVGKRRLGYRQGAGLTDSHGGHGPGPGQGIGHGHPIEASSRSETSLGVSLSLPGGLEVNTPGENRRVSFSHHGSGSEDEDPSPLPLMSSEQVMELEGLREENKVLKEAVDSLTAHIRELERHKFFNRNGINASSINQSSSINSSSFGVVAGLSHVGEREESALSKECARLKEELGNLREELETERRLSALYKTKAGPEQKTSPVVRKKLPVSLLRKTSMAPEAKPMLLLRTLNSVRAAVFNKMHISDEKMNVANFVARLVQEKVINHPEELAAPGIHTFDGAFVFADCSGFTALAERLQKTVGNQAAEHLCQILEGFFGRLIQFIHDHGGDIYKFAGDALLVVWDTAKFNGNMPRCVMVATHCAVKATQTLHNYDTGQGVKLSLHSGVGCGRMHVIYMGGEFGRWEFVIDGEPMQQIAVAVDQAARGEVACSPRVWDFVKSICKGHPIMGTDGYVKIDSIQAVGEAPLAPLVLNERQNGDLSKFLPAAIKSALAAGGSSAIAEMREVSVIFVKLMGLNGGDDPGYDPPDLDLWHRMMVCLQKAIYQYEGSINKILIDDKGVIAVAVFGLPPLSHSDDPKRACLASLMLSSKLKEMGLATKIGITTGRTFCGTVGSDLRREYTVMGPIVNMSARLMGSAEKNTVVVDVNTKLDSSNDISFEELPPLNLKGMPAPVNAFRAVRRVLSLKRPDPPFTGRSKEMSVLKDFILRKYLDVHGKVKDGGGHAGEGDGSPARSSAPRSADPSTDILGAVAQQEPQVSKGVCVIIEGATGVGKSRLLDALCDKARSSGMMLSRGQGPMPAVTGAMVIRGKKYEAIREMILELFGGANGASEIGVQVQGFLNPGEPNLSPLINDAIAGLNQPENEATRNMSPGERAKMLSTLLRRVFASVTSPCVLVVDNMQTLDNESWAMLRFCVDVGYCLILSGRPMQNTTVEYDQLRALPSTIYMDLPPLSRQATDEISRFCLSHISANGSSTATVSTSMAMLQYPAELLDRIWLWSEGNPRHVDEIVAYMANRKLITISHGKILILCKRLSDEPIPRVIEAAHTTIIDKLAPNIKALLKVACVLGFEFSTYSVIQVSPPNFTENIVHSLLEILVRLGITELLPAELAPSEIATQAAEIEELLSRSDPENKYPLERIRRNGVLSQWYRFKSRVFYDVILSRMLTSEFKKMRVVSNRKMTQIELRSLSAEIMRDVEP